MGFGVCLTQYGALPVLAQCHEVACVVYRAVCMDIVQIWRGYDAVYRISQKMVCVGWKIIYVCDTLGG